MKSIVCVRKKLFHTITTLLLKCYLVFYVSSISLTCSPFRPYSTKTTVSSATAHLFEYRIALTKKLGYFRRVTSILKRGVLWAGEISDIPVGRAERKAELTTGSEGG